MFVKRGEEELRVQQVIEVGLVLAAAAAAAANAACVPERAGLKRETPSRAETTDTTQNYTPTHLAHYKWCDTTM